MTLVVGRVDGPRIAIASDTLISDIILHCLSLVLNLTTLRRVIYRCAFSDTVLTPQ
jgi:hypothetical protein